MDYFSKEYLLYGKKSQQQLRNDTFELKKLYYKSKCREKVFNLGTDYIPRTNIACFE